MSASNESRSASKSLTKDNHPNERARFALPGDSIGAEEEFEAGPGAETIGGSIISSRVGLVSRDMSKRILTVKPAKRNLAKLPGKDDYITGTVQSAASSIAQITIETINEEPSTKDFTGMLSFRDGERHRRSSPVKPGDIVRAKVSSTTNSIFHLTIDCPNCGVLYTVCSFCGGRVVALGQGAVKCTDCNSVDDRVLSEDFVAYSRSQQAAVTP